MSETPESCHGEEITLFDLSPRKPMDLSQSSMSSPSSLGPDAVESNDVDETTALHPPSAENHLEVDVAATSSPEMAPPPKSPSVHHDSDSTAEDDSPIKTVSLSRANEYLESDNGSRDSSRCSSPVKRTDPTAQDSDRSAHSPNLSDASDSEATKVGRWTHSTGAARKSQRSKKSKSQADEKAAIYHESHRLLRETEVRLPEHRPKQFSRFSDFCKALHQTNGSPALIESNDTLPNTDNLLVPEVKPAVIEPTPVSDPAAPSTNDLPQKPSKLNPEALPPLKIPSVDDEGFIDLGEAVMPSTAEPLTPADRLLARLKEHTRVPLVKKKAGPIEYTVVTKVTDDTSGTERVRLEKVEFKPTASADMISGSQARKYWQKHRKQLEEQMRERRLKLYEERLMAEGGVRPMCKPPPEKELSDGDEEWSEGEEEEELSSGESSSSSSSETDDEDQEEDAMDEDDDEEDEIAPSSRRKCAFADDEAEESDDDDDDASSAETAGDGSESDESERGEASHFHSKHGKINQVVKPVTTNDKLYLDDYTDLPSQPIEDLPIRTPFTKPMLDNSRQPQGSLGPGDVDLFASDYSTVSNRSLNTTSVLASTRLDTTTVAGSRLVHEHSAHSQWNETPYELLYSQKPVSQAPSFTKQMSTLSDDTVILDPGPTPNLSSQDTVLLSQASLHGNENKTDVTQALTPDDSQAEHARRCNLFGDSGTSEQLKAPPPQNPSDDLNVVAQDSQSEHAARHQLFGGSQDISHPLSSNDPPIRTTEYLTDTEELPTATVSEQRSISAVTQDSQTEHSMRRQLFADPPVATMDALSTEATALPATRDTEQPPTPPVSEQQSISAVTQESQLEHSMRRKLFDDFTVCTLDLPAREDATPPETDCITQESQQEHSLRRQLFDNFTAPCEPESQANESQASLFSQHMTQDSQPEHSMHRQLFTSMPNSTGDVSVPTDVHPLEIECAATQESQVEHSMRRQLFGTFNNDVSQQNADGTTTTEEIDQCAIIQVSEQEHAPLQTASLVKPESPISSKGQQAITSFFSSTQIPRPATDIQETDQLLAKSIDEDDDKSTQDETKLHRRHRIVCAEDLDDDSDVVSIRKTGLKQDSPERIKGVRPIDPEDSEDVEDDQHSNDPNESDAETEVAEEKEEDEGTSDEDDFEESDGKELDSSDEEERLRAEVTRHKSDPRKVFRVDEFIDEEAELSGDENERAYFGGDDDDDDDDNAGLEDLELIDDKNIPSAGRLRRQVERVHQRLQADQDQRELRFLKELYFEDGDLYAENGRTRQRRFRWRGLDADDPFLNPLDDDEDQGSDDDEDGAARFGPMDKWLQGGVHRKPTEANVSSVDLDAPTNGTPVVVNSASEDEENRPDTGIPGDALASSVSSLGRIAVLKAQTQENHLVVVSSKNVSHPNKARGATAKPFPAASQPITGFFGSATKGATAESPAIRSSLQHDSTCSAVPVITSRLSLGKHGSLLGRLSSSSSTQTPIHAETDQLSEDDNSNLDTPKPKPNQTAQFLGLRNKVGLACFNVRTASATPRSCSQPLSQIGTDVPRPKSITRPSAPGKRTSVDSIGQIDLKKRRSSSSIFSALR